MNPFLVFSDNDGRIYSHPYLRMAGESWYSFCVPQPPELRPLPKGSTLFMMPGRRPVGYDPQTGEYVTLDEFEGRRVWALAAFLPPSYLRLYTPAAIVDDSQVLPLWAYAAAGYYSGGFYAAAMRVDRRNSYLPRYYADCTTLGRKIEERLARRQHNRLYAHFAHCAVEYKCQNAMNLFYGRGEAPLVVSNVCNARCLGCLSLRQQSDCDSSHERITFVPSPEEVAEVACDHIARAREPIVSFGQGCEGEPLLRADVIEAALRLIRARTGRGTIHLNSNASVPRAVARIADAGLDSIRVSMNSVRERYYNAYFRPNGYRFADVVKSIRLAKARGVHVAINLFMYPGFTDRPEEVAALLRFVEKHRIDMIQLRNLNIDPVLYRRTIESSKKEALGLYRLVEILRRELPQLRLGYFNVPIE